MARRSVILLRLSLGLLLSLAATGACAAAPGRTAVLVDLRIDEPVSGDVAVFGADLELGAGARVEGDAVAVGGDIRMGDGAHVGRHVVAVFGGAEVSRGAEVGGRVLSFTSLATLLPASSGRGPSLRTNVPMRLLTAGGWLLVTTGIAFLFPIRMRYGAWAVMALGIKVAALGLMAGVTVVASLIAALGLGPSLGVPLVAALMVVFFVAKSIGLTVLGCWAGGAVLRRWIRQILPIGLEVFVGVMILLVVRFLPVVGETLWNLVSLVALGASIVVLGASPGLMRAEPSSANH